MEHVYKHVYKMYRQMRIHDCSYKCHDAVASCRRGAVGDLEFASLGGGWRVSASGQIITSTQTWYTNVYMDICVCIHTYVYVYIYIYTYVHVYVCIYMYTYMYTDVYVCMYTHVCKHIQM